jgi:hypothetical protein
MSVTGSRPSITEKVGGSVPCAVRFIADVANSPMDQVAKRPPQFRRSPVTTVAKSVPSS